MNDLSDHFEKMLEVEGYMPMIGWLVDQLAQDTEWLKANIHPRDVSKLQELVEELVS